MEKCRPIRRTTVSVASRTMHSCRLGTAVLRPETSYAAAVFMSAPSPTDYSAEPTVDVTCHAIEQIPRRSQRPAHRLHQRDERAFDRLIGGSRCRPAIEQSVHDPDDEECEHTGEHRVAEEVSARHDAQAADAGAESERSCIGDRAVGGWRDGGRRHGPECGAAIAGDERAVLLAFAARIPPRAELLR